MKNAAELIQIARAAQKNAYAPYSGFSVGAALLTRGGKLYTGANIENVSYGLTVCAERTAIFKAVSEGDKEFSCLAVVGSGTGTIVPCGACLQVMAEFCPSLTLFLADETDCWQEAALSELLPRHFRL